MYARDGKMSLVSFKWKDHIMRIPVVECSAEDDVARLTPSGSKRAARKALLEADRETRRRWRVLLLVLKAKIEAINAGVLAMEEEFLPYMLLKNGATVADWSRTADFRTGLESGKMPLIGNGGPR